MPESRMNAYYFGFDKTGEHDIDLILSAIATAGKMYHGTEDWSEKDDDGKSPVDRIQDAANAAAAHFKALRGES